MNWIVNFIEIIGKDWLIIIAGIIGLIIVIFGKDKNDTARS